MLPPMEEASFLISIALPPPPHESELPK